MNVMGFYIPILSLLIFLPLVGALLVLFIKKEQVNTIRGVTLVTSVVVFLLSLLVLPYYDGGSAEFQFIEKIPWIQSIGVTYFLGMDGISLWLVLLTTLLTAISVLASWDPIKERVKEYMVFMLILETGMLGVFLSLDFFLFYVFWEVMLVPMYFLIGVWGGPRKLYAAIKFFLYTLFGSVLMLLGILAIYFHHYNLTGELTFDYTKLLSPGLPYGLQWWVFLAFFIGFAIKVPMFPFHTWLPDAHVEAPTAGSVILAGVLLKMGTYGFVRFSLPLMPNATVAFVPFMIVLSIIGIVYGAMVAMVQKDMKKLVAYSSVSHLGFVMLGLFALNYQGISGGMLQMVNHGLSTGALFLLVGVIYDRRHTRLIAEYGGLSKQMPIYAAFFAFIMFSSIGLPGLNGFIGEFLILVGAFKVNMYWALVATTGIVLGAAYMLWMYQRVMFGKMENPANMNLPDLTYKEVLALAPIMVLCLWIGVYPAPFLNRMDASVNKIVKQVETAKIENGGSKLALNLEQIKALKGQETVKAE